MSATSADAARSANAVGGRRPRLRRPGRRAATIVYGALLTAALSGFGLLGGGGLQLGRMTYTEIAVDSAAALVAAVAVLAARGPKLWGFAALTAFAAYVLLLAASILWSVDPSESWLEANRAFSWLAVCGAGLALARCSGRWWNATLSAIALSAVIICGWALLSRIFPQALADDEIYARLRAPYDYWNSVGLTAAIGIVAAVWLAVRRNGHSALSALGYPATVLLMTALMLSYSRGALLALALALALWLLVVPLRLRSAAVLICGIGGGLLIAWWAFSQDTLTTDRVPAAARATSGLQLGAALLIVMTIALIVGLIVRFRSDRRPLATIARRRIAALLLVGLILTPVALVAALIGSESGLRASVRSAWASLTDPNQTTAVANDPSRLTKVSSVRAKYWQEAIAIYRERPLLGAGGGAYTVARKRHRTGTLTVRHAHGFIVQTAADLGTIGLAIIALATIAWLAAADRTLGAGRRLLGALRRRRRPPPAAGLAAASPNPERVGLTAMVAIVVLFCLHSSIDWTWYVPGNAIVAMICVGWVAGRGTLKIAPTDPQTLLARARAGLSVPLRAAAATLLLLIGAAAAWSAWQPLAASNDVAAAQALARPDDRKSWSEALALIAKASSENPLAIEPLLAKAYVESLAGRPDEARRSLVEATRLQPTNPETWIQLADFTLQRLNDSRRAAQLLRPALYLDPHSEDATLIYLEATRQTAAEKEAEQEQKRQRSDTS